MFVRHYKQMDTVAYILSEIEKTSNTLKWRDIVHLCNKKGFRIVTSKKGYKVYVKTSVWSVHLEHRTSDELKRGIIREFKKILVKEQILLK